MGWADIFPVMDDEALQNYETSSAETKAEIQSLFAINSIHNAGKNSHIVSTSLFWKSAYLEDPDFPPITKELMQDPASAGLPTRFKNPWEHYFLPILAAAKNLKKERPDVTFRVYLANDLEFLIPDLVEAHCEVYLIETSSIRHNPGAMWRFLAMEEECLVTITDSDRSAQVIHDIERTEEIATGGLNYWRVAYFIGKQDDGVGSIGTYRTTLACQFGCSSPLPMKLLCEAFVWNSIDKNLRDHAQLGQRKIPIFGSEWPTFGFDEYFLNTAIFPRIANEGVVTFVPWDGSSVGSQPLNHWFALDIEYCTWANPKSEIIFFGSPEAETAKAISGTAKNINSAQA
jgi:hypothetical protein